MSLFSSFPIAYQHDGMQCGVACLKMVCEFFGRKYSLDALSQVCFATTEGVSMLGYYPVSAGNILIGDTDINDLDKKWWRRQCGVVMQDGVIFSDSIARNIAVGDGPIDYKRMEEAARMASIWSYIETLPLRYDTKIGRDGVGLSQGQKQRILIARAIYKDPEYIFLDEATNSLDSLNERMIVESLNLFYKKKTVVVVAHRLSTVRNADNIVVMRDGKIVEAGDHERLIKLHGFYDDLIKNQLELGD